MCTYNPGQNILELDSVLVRVWFATNETKLDIYYNKLGINSLPNDLRFRVLGN